jgi:hypothetical protein
MKLFDVLGKGNCLVYKHFLVDATACDQKCIAAFDAIHDDDAQGGSSQNPFLTTIRPVATRASLQILLDEQGTCAIGQCRMDARSIFLGSQCGIACARGSIVFMSTVRFSCEFLMVDQPPSVCLRRETRYHHLAIACLFNSLRTYLQADSHRKCKSITLFVHESMPLNEYTTLACGVTVLMGQQRDAAIQQPNLLSFLPTPMAPPPTSLRPYVFFGKLQHGINPLYF